MLNILFFYFLISSSLFAITPALSPLIHSLENRKYLSKNKYSDIQLQKIKLALAQQENIMRVVSYNFLFDGYEKGIDPLVQTDPKFYWKCRLSGILDILKDMDADLIGAQELSQQQVNDILESLEIKYAFFGQPDQFGEISGIFYKPDRFTVLDSKVWQLSDIGPNILASATLTSLKLEDKITSNLFAIFNTHLDFYSPNKRLRQTQLLKQYITGEALSCPIILTGDFNTFPSRIDIDTIPFYDGEVIDEILKGEDLVDTIDSALIGHLGPISSFTNKDEDVTPFKGTGLSGMILDHIYISKEIISLIHAIHPGKFNHNFPSDHMPVLADILIPICP